MGNNFTEGNVRKSLILFSVPIILGMFLQTAYDLINTFFLGMLGPKEIAAVSLFFPINFIFIAIAGGLGIGANALIAQAYGRKDLNEANNIAEHAVFLGLFMGFVFTFLGIAFSGPLFIFMGADAELLPMAMEYSTPILFGMIFMFLWFISNSIITAEGNSKTPLVNLAISLALNAALDPLLIFGLGPFPKMGLYGAAIASVIAMAFSAFLNFAYLYSKKSSINLCLGCFRPRAKYVKDVLAIGIPALLVQALSAAGFMLLMSIVGSFGSLAMAAYGIGMRLNSVIMLPLLGLEDAAISYVGQNIGARKEERAKKAVVFLTQVSFAITIVLSAAAYFFPEFILRIFTSDADVISMGKVYFSIVPISFIIYSLYFVLAYFLSQTMGLEGVWIAIVAAALIELIFVFWVYFSGAWLGGKRVILKQ